MGGPEPGATQTSETTQPLIRLGGFFSFVAKKWLVPADGAHNDHLILIN